MSINITNISYQNSKKLKTAPKTNNISDLLNKDIKLFGNNLSDKKKERFYSDLHILLESGIDIKSSLELIANDQKKSADKEMFINIENLIIKGKSLSDALQNTGKFSNYEFYSIKIGEESGRLNIVLEELSIYYNKKIKQSKQIINAFSYPVLVLITAIGAVFFMLNYIVPMFKDIFKRFNSELPSITKLVIDASEFLSSYSILIFIVIIGIVAFIMINKRKEWYRNLASKLLLKLPLFGPIVKMIYLARFSQSMALLISSRTPMLQAIKLVKNMIDFYPYEKALGVISDKIMNGKTLNESMMQFPIFDKRTVSLIKVAEEVNQLDTIFAKLNKQFNDELEYRISLVSSMLEPIMIIFIGLLVGVILVSMYLPMFQLGTTISG